MLDAVALSARGWAGLVLAAHVLTRRARTARLTRVVFRDLLVETETEQPWELDGEVMGRTRRLVIAAQPGRLLFRIPADRQ